MSVCSIESATLNIYLKNNNKSCLSRAINSRAFNSYKYCLFLIS
ncbi:hypothetical protein A1OE_74 [Candidatus Endolissoclinum faulkneri L2]|uniref:Uncharacterized protein n=1 Tax=Candidatus Endolissoclinum faulkneri L2 TaxID=1193729 RepID=K7Z2T9_9PROT|nr:hypothetical protein A1OE_74 [Candidatus Endolissoclinum faulkneri L2]